jgi:hypothetical protein
MLPVYFRYASETSISMVNVSVRHVNACKKSQIAEIPGFGNLCFVRWWWAVGFPGAACWPPEANMAGLRSRRPADLRASKPLTPHWFIKAGCVINSSVDFNGRRSVENNAACQELEQSPTLCSSVVGALYANGLSPGCTENVLFYKFYTRVPVNPLKLNSPNSFSPPQ